LSLVSIPGVDATTIGKGAGGGLVSWGFSGEVGDCCGGAEIKNGVVSLITINTLRSVTLGEVVAELGEPEQVSAISGEADARWLTVSLLYPRLGVAAIYFDKPFTPVNGLAETRLDAPVFELVYFDLVKYNQLLESDVFTGVGADPDTIIDSLQEWQGFGLIRYSHLED
jgi:hypothetical protein